MNLPYPYRAGGSSAGSYLADPTSPIPSPCSWCFCFQTALHELFHALGFSSNLFNQFKDCKPGDTPDNFRCFPKPNSVKSIFNAKRLVSRKVVSITSDHYNCVTHASINEFGPILQTKVRKESIRTFRHGIHVSSNSSGNDSIHYYVRLIATWTDWELPHCMHHDTLAFTYY